MASARDELLSHQSGPIVPLTEASADWGIDLDHFLLDVMRSKDLDIDVARSVTDGTIERAFDIASNIQVTIHDPRRVLLESDIWNYAIDVNLDDNWFRLVQVAKDGDDLQLTFEDRVKVWLTYHNKPLKVSRNKMTRAEFIKKMIDEIKADNKLNLPLHFYSPQLHKKQPTAKPKKESTRRKNKEPGLNKKIKVKDPRSGNELKKEQKVNIERVLDVGYDMDAPEVCLIVAMMVIYQESTLLTSATNGVHVGLFQQNPKYWPGTRNPEKDAKAFFKALIANYKKGEHSTGPQGLPGRQGPTDLAALAESVQGSGQPTLYGQWETWARGVVKEYNGGKGGGDDDETTSYERTYAKSYQFSRGQPQGEKGENSWEAARRLADEVQWRFFIVGNTIYYVTDWDLLKAKPVMVIEDEDNEDGVISVDFDWDVGKRTSECVVTCRAERWLAHPGEVVVLGEKFGPAAGRWLVQRISRPLFSTTTTITLYTPHHSKKEPAPELNTVTKDRKPRRGSQHGEGGGNVKVAAGANRAGVPMTDLIMTFLGEVARHTDEEIIVTTGTAHNRLTTSGNVSDHWAGNGADIGIGPDIRGGGNKRGASKGDNIATAALLVCGVPRERAHQWATSGALNFGMASNHRWRGHTVQIGWRTDVGGNHYNHVHIGVS